jgi:hypothetical protein
LSSRLIDFQGDIDNVSVIPIPGIYAVLSGGTDDDWDNSDEYRIVPPTNWVYMENFCFELPAGCSNYTVSVLNDLDEGAIYAHQLQILPNKAVNGGMEGTYVDGGVGGNLMVAPGWSHKDCEDDGSDLLSKETTIVHSGGASQKIDVSLNAEGIKDSSNVFTSGKWYLIIVWLYGNGSDQVQISNHTSSMFSEILTPPAAWTRYSWVAFADVNSYLLIKGYGGATTFYEDDVSIIELDDTTITAIPRSLENSTDPVTGAVDIDGGDVGYIDIPEGLLGPTEGSVEFKFNLRHGEGDFEKFGIDNPMIADIYKDVNNRIYFIAVTDSILRLYSVVGGVSSNTSWTPTGELSIDTEYQGRIDWTATDCKLYVDNVLKITVTPGAGIDFGVNVPDKIYLGSKYDGTHQIDASFR